MPRLRLHLRTDPKTGRKDVIVDYESDPDALPWEHEEQHGKQLDKLLADGTLKARESGRIDLKRLATATVELPDADEVTIPDDLEESQ